MPIFPQTHHKKEGAKKEGAAKIRDIRFRNTLCIGPVLSKVRIDLAPF